MPYSTSFVVSLHFPVGFKEVLSTVKETLNCSFHLLNPSSWKDERMFDLLPNTILQIFPVKNKQCLNTHLFGIKAKANSLNNRSCLCNVIKKANLNVSFLAPKVLEHYKYTFRIFPFKCKCAPYRVLSDQAVFVFGSFARNNRRTQLRQLEQ